MSAPLHCPYLHPVVKSLKHLLAYVLEVGTLCEYNVQYSSSGTSSAHPICLPACGIHMKYRRMIQRQGAAFWLAAVLQRQLVMHTQISAIGCSMNLQPRHLQHLPCFTMTARLQHEQGHANHTRYVQAGSSSR